MSATILVVDDDGLTLTLVERTLRAGGYRVWTAGGAPEARRLLQELAGAVDLVLTDIAMPGGLGTERDFERDPLADALQPPRRDPAPRARVRRPSAARLASGAPSRRGRRT